MHRITATALLGLTVLACGSVTEIGDGEGDGGEPGSAELRVIHASPDAPPVDIYVNGETEPLIANIAYGEATHYLEVPAGDYEVEIRAAGADPTSDPVFTDLVSLGDGDRASAIAAGLLGSTDAGSQFRLVAILEDFAQPDPGFAIVRIVHAGADAPAVGIDVGADGSVELADLERFSDTGVDGVPLPAGQTLRVGIVAGFPPAEVTSFSLPELPDGGELLVIATGLLSAAASDADGFSLLAVTPTATGRVIQDPVVFALHASPDAPAIDLFTPDTVRLASNLSFGQLSGAVRFPAGSQQIDFWPAGIEHGAAPAASANATLSPGTDYLLVATGFVAPAAGEAPFQLIAVADEFDRQDPTNARVRVVHAAPDAPAVDVGAIDAHGLLSALLVQDLGFSSTSLGKGVSVAPHPIDVGIAATGSSSIVAGFAIAPEAGARAFVVAAGALGAGRGQSFRLIAVDTTSFPWTAAAVHAF